MKIESQNIFSITAFIDLLGFSGHLEFSSFDLRTNIGKEAVERLEILENCLGLIEEEFKKCPQFYPNSFRSLRFNDALILGMDVQSEFLPAIGHPDKGQRVTFGELQDFKERNKDISEDPVKKHLDDLSFEVSQFIGLASRAHNFINDSEYKLNMPGCRTTISTGLRHRFIRKKDNSEDYYSANFSFSNAYVVNELGSKHGFGGNKCYLEQNVAQICAFNIYTKRALGYTKFVYGNNSNDPYDGKSDSILIKKPGNFTISQLKEVTLFRKKYLFREINTNPGSNMQLFPSIIDLAESLNQKRSPVYQNFLNCILTDTRDLASVNDVKNSMFTDPISMPIFLTTGNSLTDPICKSINQLK